MNYLATYICGIIVGVIATWLWASMQGRNMPQSLTNEELWIIKQAVEAEWQRRREQSPGGIL